MRDVHCVCVWVGGAHLNCRFLMFGAGARNVCLETWTTGHVVAGKQGQMDGGWGKFARCSLLRAT